jgi:glycyl-tRNA synthetase beta chain
MSEYFFELLTEEIPAWMHDTAATTLTQRLLKLVEELGGEAGSVCVNTTPRRIAVMLAKLPERESDRELEVKGPPKKAAYDASGNPTQALNGFLKKNNATIENVIDAGDYVMVRKQITGRGIDEILREQIPQIIESIRWPKMMRWGKGEHSYIRPIHSVISLFDGRHAPIRIFGVESGTTTVGHRTLAPQKIEVGSYNEYVTKLELARVVVDAMRRRHVMAERARILGNDAGGTPSIDASIWSQWQYLTEYPGVVRAEFRREYLALPEEVLVTVMRVHQKQLPIRDAAGRLMNSFLAVLDNEGDPLGNAAYGNSFVTNARFADAKFFYETDRKRKLEERLEQLEHLQFQEKLGNYAEKTKRIERIVRDLGGNADALTAARLCKTDLVTEMVKEFTDLQGQIGGIYAREEGYSEAVWQAIYDQYALPRSMSGALVSLADRIDTLAGFFSIGAKPTGSKDPFALRRAAQGIVQILLLRDQREVKIGIDRLIDLGVGQAPSPVHPAPSPVPAQPPSPSAGQAGAPDLHAELLAFFAERVKTILEQTFAYDEVAAAMEAGWATSLTDLSDRVDALRAVREDANFLSILDSAKRIANITAGHAATTVDAARLEHETEKRLNGLADVVGNQVDDLIAERRYRVALESFAALAPELEKFFDDVMVMVDDEELRRNRMSLLRKVGNAVTKIADVTKIVIDRRDYK